MRKYFIVVSSFLIMLCLGSIYAWSIFVPELTLKYGFTSTQTQLIFGILIGVFPMAMILASYLEKNKGVKFIIIFSSLFFSSGYFLAGISNANYYLVLIGISFLAGIGTGFGYYVSIITTVKWFPQKKGLITGIASAGFGLGAVFLSNIVEILFKNNYNVFQVFIYIAIVYGVLILLGAIFMKSPTTEDKTYHLSFKSIIKLPNFGKLFFGILSGTFAGLLIIGNLKSIGAISIKENHVLILGISIFAGMNFFGRLFWGFISDHIGSRLSIFINLIGQAISIFLLGFLNLTPISYLFLSGIIGFHFGGNFVLFAKETAEKFGSHNLGSIYPYVFMGYAISGILGPFVGGELYDIFHQYSYAIYIASGISLVGSFLFFSRKTDNIKSI